MATMNFLNTQNPWDAWLRGQIAEKDREAQQQRALMSSLISMGTQFGTEAMGNESAEKIASTKAAAKTASDTASQAAKQTQTAADNVYKQIQSLSKKAQIGNFFSVQEKAGAKEVGNLFNSGQARKDIDRILQTLKPEVKDQLIADHGSEFGFSPLTDDDRAQGLTAGRMWQQVKTDFDVGDAKTMATFSGNATEETMLERQRAIENLKKYPDLESTLTKLKTTTEGRQDPISAADINKLAASFDEKQFKQMTLEQGVFNGIGKFSKRNAPYLEAKSNIAKEIGELQKDLAMLPESSRAREQIIAEAATKKAGLIDSVFGKANRFNENGRRKVESDLEGALGSGAFIDGELQPKLHLTGPEAASRSEGVRFINTQFKELNTLGILPLVLRKFEDKYGMNAGELNKSSFIEMYKNLDNPDNREAIDLFSNYMSAIRQMTKSKDFFGNARSISAEQAMAVFDRLSLGKTSGIDDTGELVLDKPIEPDDEEGILSKLLGGMNKFIRN